MSADHISAIHTLAGRLGLSEGARRDVMQMLVGKRSCSEMTVAERAAVRQHLARQVERQGPQQFGPAAAGVADGSAGRSGRAQRMTPAEFARAKAQASPRERKVWALWHALQHAGLITHADRAALDAWVLRTVGVSTLRFCTTAQLDTCIEALKVWGKRATAKPMTPAKPSPRAAPTGQGGA